MPCRTAPACPERPPPVTVQMTSYWFTPVDRLERLVDQHAQHGAREIDLQSRPLTVIRPVPGLTQTRATASLRRPVA